MIARSILLLALLPALATAAEGHAAPIGQIVYPLINFAIFAFLLYRFAIPGLRAYLLARRERLQRAIDEAAAEQTSAERALSDYRTRLERVAQETERIREELRREGEWEKQRSIDEAARAAARIAADADFLASQEIKAARQRLRERMAELVEEHATRLIRGGLTPADQRRLIAEFVAALGETR
jgi:F-type H+-transporting ATPase subunit b